MSVSEGHTHRIYASLISFPTTTQPLLPDRAEHDAPGVPLNIQFSEWSVAIPRLDVNAGAQKTYTTTLDDGHTHTLTLTAADMQALRSGGTVRKQTSRDNRQGGRPHTHEVVVSCALAVASPLTVQPTTIRGLDGQLGQQNLLPEQETSIAFIQAYINDILQQRGLPQIRADGIVDLQTCLALADYQLRRDQYQQQGLVDAGTRQQLDQLLASFSPQFLQDLCRQLQQPGVTPPPPPAVIEPAETCFYGFGDQSPAIAEVRRQINFVLVSQGYAAIPETTEWDQMACGALFFVYSLGLPNVTREGFPQLSQCPAGAVFDLSCPAFTPQRVGAPTAAAPDGGGGGVIAALALAALLVGGYYVLQT
jgi:hypothetical protein